MSTNRADPSLHVPTGGVFEELFMTGYADNVLFEESYRPKLGKRDLYQESRI